MSSSSSSSSSSSMFSLPLGVTSGRSMLSLKTGIMPSESRETGAGGLGLGVSTRGGGEAGSRDGDGSGGDTAVASRSESEVDGSDGRPSSEFVYVLTLKILSSPTEKEVCVIVEAGLKINALSSPAENEAGEKGDSDGVVGIDRSSSSSSSSSSFSEPSLDCEYTSPSISSSDAPTLS